MSPNASRSADRDRGPQLHNDMLSEDSVKRAIDTYLRAEGWIPIVCWGRTRGIDIDARRGTERWIIEAKGRGTSPQHQGNNFLSALGELLQRMSDPKARYSIAVPDLPRYRGLWVRLPTRLKRQLRLSSLFVNESGTVEEV